MTEAGPAQRRPPSRSPRHLRPWQRPLGAAVVVLTIAGVASFAPIATASASASPVSHFEGVKQGGYSPPDRSRPRTGDRVCWRRPTIYPGRPDHPHALCAERNSRGGLRSQFGDVQRDPGAELRRASDI